MTYKIGLADKDLEKQDSKHISNQPPPYVSNNSSAVQDFDDAGDDGNFIDDDEERGSIVPLPRSTAPASDRKSQFGQRQAQWTQMA